MALFQHMVPVTKAQAVHACDALQRGEPAVFIVDPQPVWVVFMSSAARGLPYEVDFACLDGRTKEPMPVTPEQVRLLKAWAEPAVGLICSTWKERYPES